MAFKSETRGELKLISTARSRTALFSGVRARK